MAGWWGGLFTERGARGVYLRFRDEYLSTFRGRGAWDAAVLHSRNIDTEMWRRVKLHVFKPKHVGGGAR